jgi:hypothetical protein
MARKPSSLDAFTTVPVADRLLRGDDETWWDAAPYFMQGNAAQVIHATCYRGDGRSQSSGLSFGLDSFPLNRVPIPEDHASLLGLVLDSIDGKRSIRQIHHNLTSNGFEVTGSDLRELFYYLSDRHGIVRIDAKIAQ